MEQVYNDVVKNVTDMNKQAMESVLRFSRIAVRTQGLLARQQLSVVENYIDAGAKHLDVVSKTRDPQEMIKMASEINVELGEKLIAVAQESMDIGAQARDELTSMVEEGIEAAQKQAEKVSNATVKSAKTATKTAKKAA